jgi:hypothetical protein
MVMQRFSQEEMQLFGAALASASAIASEHGIELPVREMTKRLFEAADNGERDPIKLRDAILKNAVPAVAEPPSRPTKP